MKHITIVVAMALLFFANSFAGDGKISGYMFGDYYYAVSNHDQDIEDQNGFWFRRIYLTYDQELNEDFAVRLRFEMNSAGDFGSKSKLEPAIKDAYLKWTRSRHSVIFGIQSTPTWGVIEKVWGYRSVEKTPLDLHRFGSSRDFGFAVKGSLDSQKRVNYHLMFANGSSNASETNGGKKVMLALSTKLNSNFVVEGYADYEERPGTTNRVTLQGFAAYQSKNIRVGAQFSHQNRQVAQGVDDLKLQIGSIFATAKISEKVWGFARVDRLFDPNPDGGKISYFPFDASAEASFFIAGLDFRPIENVRIMPNIEAAFYDKAAGDRPDIDFMPRVTLFYNWK